MYGNNNIPGNNGNQNGNPMGGPSQGNGQGDIGGVFQDAERYKSTSGLALAEGNKGRLGSRAPSKSSGLEKSDNSSSGGGSSSSSISGSSSSTSKSSDSQRISDASSRRNNDNFKKRALETAANKYLSTKVPPALAKRIVGSKVAQTALDKVSNNKKKTGGLKNLELGKADKTKDIDAKSESSKKSDEEEQEKIRNGEISAEIPKKILKFLVIVGPIVSLVILFTVIVVSILSDDASSRMIISEIASKSDKSELKEITKSLGKGSDAKELALGKGDNGIPDEYYDRLSYLGNLYSSELECEEDDCLDRPEFQYYLKIADIAYRYRTKYSVKLDWYLISATNLYFSSTTEETMKANLGGYSESSVTNTNSTISLDWDYDYKNINGYQYLDADDSRYDLQILAKNMVTKKTTQTCKDSSGNVVNKQEDEDVEDKYFAENGEKRLKCGSGQTYSISSTYTEDMDKFDEFMLEYIDLKIYSKGSGKGDTSRKNSVNGNDLSEVMVNLALEQLNDPDAVNGYKYWSFKGFGGRVEWCACFVSWVVAHAEHNGQNLADIVNYEEIPNTAAVFNWMNYFYESDELDFVFNDNCSKLAGKNGNSGTYTPKQGDLIFFDWNNVFYDMPTDFGHVSHIGIVQRTEDDKIITIEGNNGNAVRESSYPINSCNVVGFGSWY